MRGKQKRKQLISSYLKGIVEGMMDSLGLVEGLHSNKLLLEGMHPGRTANIYHNNKRIGFIGQIHPTEQNKRDLKDTYVMEMNLDKILSIETDELLYVPVPRHPVYFTGHRTSCFE